MSDRYRKKPVEVRAWQWLFSPEQKPSPVWIMDALSCWPAIGGVNFEPEHPAGPRMLIVTLEGVMVASLGDWIIQGVKGELYPCKPDIFALTYTPVELDAPQFRPGAVSMAEWYGH